MNNYHIFTLGSLLVTLGIVAGGDKFKASPYLTSKESKDMLEIILKKHPSHLPQYRKDHCNENSPEKNRKECEELILELYRGTGTDRGFAKVQNVRAYLGEKPENCKIKYQDPIECAKCFSATRPEISYLDEWGYAHLYACSR